MKQTRAWDPESRATALFFNKLSCMEAYQQGSLVYMLSPRLTPQNRPARLSIITHTSQTEVH